MMVLEWLIHVRLVAALFDRATDPHLPASVTHEARCILASEDPGPVGQALRSKASPQP